MSKYAIYCPSILKQTQVRLMNFLSQALMFQENKQTTASAQHRILRAPAAAQVAELSRWLDFRAETIICCLYTRQTLVFKHLTFLLMSSPSLSVSPTQAF